MFYKPGEENISGVGEVKHYIRQHLTGQASGDGRLTVRFQQCLEVAADKKQLSQSARTERKSSSRALGRPGNTARLLGILRVPLGGQGARGLGQSRD